MCKHQFTVSELTPIGIGIGVGQGIQCRALDVSHQKTSVRKLASESWRQKVGVRNLASESVRKLASESWRQKVGIRKVASEKYCQPVQ